MPDQNILFGSLPRLRSKTFTFRLESDILEKLAQEAKKENVSSNVIANRALRKYVDWDITAEKFRLISAFPESLVKLMSWLSDEHARELGRWQWQEAMVPLALSRYGERGFDPEVAVLDLFGKYGRLYRFDLSTTHSRHILMITHHLGKRWSLFFEGMLEALLRENIPYGAGSFDISSSENQVLAEVSASTILAGQNPSPVPRSIDPS